MTTATKYKPSGGFVKDWNDIFSTRRIRGYPATVILKKPVTGKQKELFRVRTPR